MKKFFFILITLIILLIIGIIIWDRFEKTVKNGITKSDLEKLSEALKNFNKQCQFYPLDGDHLYLLLPIKMQQQPPCEGFPENGFLDTIKKDPWFNNYNYQLDKYGVYFLWSNGPDGLPNTADDISFKSTQIGKDRNEQAEEYDDF